MITSPSRWRSFALFCALERGGGALLKSREMKRMARMTNKPMAKIRNSNFFVLRQS